jgi:hypothetical protein
LGGVNPRHFWPFHIYFVLLQLKRSSNHKKVGTIVLRMKKNRIWMMVAILVCGLMLTACSIDNDDSSADDYQQ